MVAARKAQVSLRHFKCSKSGPRIQPQPSSAIVDSISALSSHGLSSPHRFQSPAVALPTTPAILGLALASLPLAISCKQRALALLTWLLPLLWFSR